MASPEAMSRFSERSAPPDSPLPGLEGREITLSDDRTVVLQHGESAGRYMYPSGSGKEGRQSARVELPVSSPRGRVDQLRAALAQGNFGESDNKHPKSKLASEVQ